MGWGGDCRSCHLRVIGCVGHVLIDSHLRQKMDSKKNVVCWSVIVKIRRVTKYLTRQLARCPSVEMWTSLKIFHGIGQLHPTQHLILWLLTHQEKSQLSTFSYFICSYWKLLILCHYHSITYNLEWKLLRQIFHKVSLSFCYLQHLLLYYYCLKSFHMWISC